MSQDPELFKAPSTYPEPPQSVWDDMVKPAAQEGSLRPIFPWEASAPKATRVFAEDLPSPVDATVGSPSLSRDDPETPTEDERVPAGATAQIASPDPWRNYTVSNIWDEIPEIDLFIDKIVHRRTGSAQVPLDDSAPEDALTSPVGLRGRKPSMRLTDFPTEFERPSLPVTPAPIRRATLWGSEREDASDFPAAQGVPSQEEWVGSDWNRPLDRTDHSSCGKKELPRFG